MHVFNNNCSSAAPKLSSEQGRNSHFQWDRNTFYNPEPIQQLKTASFFEKGIRHVKPWGFINENSFVFSFTVLYSFQALGFKFILLAQRFKKQSK